MLKIPLCSLLLSLFILPSYSFASPSQNTVLDAFKAQSLSVTSSDISKIGPDIDAAIKAKCEVSPTGGNSKIGFAAVQIASKLGLNPKIDSSVVTRVENAVKTLPCESTSCANAGCVRPTEDQGDWNKYFNETLNLSQNQRFLSLLNDKNFSPVKISWEDIGRYANSAWGDRISDVGIWVRKDEHDPSSAELALSVRRDNNFRDKILVVPSHKIKIHTKEGDETREVDLKSRLSELKLNSKSHDDNVIVSNQFAIVPVPARDTGREPARAAFTFSIFPYGSTNFVITDVIEGSSNAIVGPGNHQLLFSNVNGEKAPFTASRAEERKDLIELEANLKAKGMDVDLQRYYLIQIPLKKDASSVVLSNMGTPPFRHWGSGGEGGAPPMMPLGGSELFDKQKSAAGAGQFARGLGKVAIGHGDTEGPYSAGSGFENQRAEEPVRVTVVYFVTPKGAVTESDMTSFSDAFKKWDEHAIWGGSFVLKE